MSTPEKGVARLTPPELVLWFAWKRAYEVMRSSVGEDISAATGLSDPDFGILARVDDAGGTMRQNALSVSMGWERSRLSHQLTRMESRQLISRRAVEGGVEIAINQAGLDVLKEARPVHVASVRHHLIDALTDEELGALREVLRTLSQDKALPDAPA